ncbi:ribonuclease H-like domain-containing protein [Tanacetum coccineum]|uniref:Ribonuclease H-like domain-containing protein n=1 Tax=Tanacetum coccineum TaxID=301880 RepID=A0ABQ4ZYA5_9ASTR
MAVNLTSGAIMKMSTGKCTENNLKPVVQVTYVHNRPAISDDEQWYWVRLSDGSSYQNGGIRVEAVRLNPVQEGSIVQLDDFVTYTIQPFPHNDTPLVERSTPQFQMRIMLMDNKCSVEFYEFGFSVKDFLTGHILLRCDSLEDLYPVTKPSPTPSALLSISHAMWHQRLRHSGAEPCSRKWPVHQLDVKNAFLNGDIIETVYMHPMLGFNDLIVMLYALVSLLVDVILLYLFIAMEFDMTDLGTLNYFLGISVTRDSTGMFLSQKKYALELLDRAYLANGNPTRMPLDTESKLGPDSDPISDPTLYRSLTEPHLAALKRILRYVHGILDFGLQLYASITGFLHQRTKVIEIEIHFVRDMVARGQVRFLHVPSRYQYADIFTKGLPSALFEEFHTSLSVRSPPAQTAREC